MARTEWMARTVTDVVGMGGSVELDEELVARAQVADWLDERDETYYLDGDADDGADDVIEALGRLAADPMEAAFREEIEEATAGDDWAVRTSDDGLTVSMSDPTYAQSRRTYYEAGGYGGGRIELEYRLGVGEWRAFDEHLPEDEADVHAMAREAYERVKAVAE